LKRVVLCECGRTEVVDCVKNFIWCDACDARAAAVMAQVARECYGLGLMHEALVFGRISGLVHGALFESHAERRREARARSSAQAAAQGSGEAQGGFGSPDEEGREQHDEAA